MMRALPLVHEAGGLMVGTGARTRLRTHEVEPSREFLRCLPVARALSPPAEACDVVLTFPAVFLFFVCFSFFQKKRKEKKRHSGVSWLVRRSCVLRAQTARYGLFGTTSRVEGCGFKRES